MMPDLLDGKAALVTGGGSGIGRATSLEMARSGARVAVADVNEDGGRETVDLIEKAGGEAVFVRSDVTSSADVQAMIRTTVESFGRLDCAVNNAGIGGTTGGQRFATHEYPDEVWTRIIAVNLTGVFLCLKHEIAQMLQQGGGAIVNISSVAGLIGGASGTAYTASKHGVAGMTRNTALEYARQGIRVNAVCPGVVDTPMVAAAFGAVPGLEERWREIEPIGRFAAPKEIAAAITWLCSDAASFVTGVALPVDGGWTAQ